MHFLIEEAVRGASCAALLKPFKGQIMVEELGSLLLGNTKGRMIGKMS